MQDFSSPRAAFLAGMKDTIPLILGALPFGIIFGALAVNSGLSVMAAMGFSLFVFAGSAQFIAVGLVAESAVLGIIVLTTFIVNLRHALYGATLAPYVRKLSQRWMVSLGFWLTDETFAVVIRRFMLNGPGEHGRWYWLGSSVLMYTNWQLCTLVGVVAGSQFEDAASWGLDVAMSVTFIGIVVPMIVNRPMLVCAVVAGVSAVVLHSLPHSLWIIAAALLGVAAGILAETYTPQPQKPARTVQEVAS